MIFIVNLLFIGCLFVVYWLVVAEVRSGSSDPDYSRQTRTVTASHGEHHFHPPRGFETRVEVHQLICDRSSSVGSDSSVDHVTTGRWSRDCGISVRRGRNPIT